MQHTSHFKLKKSNEPSQTRNIWNYRTADFDTFNRQLEQSDIQRRIEEAETIDQASDIFTQTYLNIADRYIPKNIITIRQKDKPWFNNDISLKKTNPKETTHP
jgi:hypothetical protein